MSEHFPVTVVYGKNAKECWLKSLNVTKGTTVEAAIRQSKLLEHYPEIDLSCQTVGIYANPVALSHELEPLAQIEIYRPLLADPKAIRKQRARKEKT